MSANFPTPLEDMTASRDRFREKARRTIAERNDLLAALEAIVDLQGKAANGLPLSENETRDWAIANNTARAAIVKARGES